MSFIFGEESEICLEFENIYSRNIISDVYSDLRGNFITSSFDLDKILSKIFSKRGKGIRPVLMCLVSGLVGGSWEKVRKASVIIEAIHLASLLHDDVLDGADLRRGDATINALYSDKVSILFGDYIFVNAIIMANELKRSDAVSIVHNAVKRMVEGEISDSLKDHVITEEEYIRIIGDKTASLFAAAGELGVILSGVNGVEKEWARELGENLGIAFQIIDDTLDYEGNSDKMGKPKYLDVMSNNMTLPLIHSLRDMTNGEIKSFLAENKKTTGKISEFVRLNDGIDYAYQRARDYSDKARKILSRFDINGAYNDFERFLEMLINRHV
ncbi:polyprenyl synthetase family protein [Candidatus Latescibacterota bacterium]